MITFEKLIFSFKTHIKRFYDNYERAIQPNRDKGLIKFTFGRNLQVIFVYIELATLFKKVFDNIDQNFDWKFSNAETLFQFKIFKYQKVCFSNVFLLNVFFNGKSRD